MLLNILTGEDEKQFEDYSRIVEPRTELNIYTENKIKEYRNLENKDNVSKYLLKKLRKEIRMLLDIIDSLDFYLYHEYFITVQKVMTRLLEKDDQINGFNIRIKLTEGNNFGYIEL